MNEDYERGARAKLAEIIARQDAARGRPLTDLEKLDNLSFALRADEAQELYEAGARAMQEAAAQKVDEMAMLKRAIARGAEASRNTEFSEFFGALVDDLELLAAAIRALPMPKEPDR